jgi:hypothetical protein
MNKSKVTRMSQNRINPTALGLSLGILSAISLLSIGLLGYFLLPKEAITASLGTWQIEYKHSFLGICIGTLLAFINCFIAGAVIAWLYNIFLPESMEGDL